MICFQAVNFLSNYLFYLLLEHLHAFNGGKSIVSLLFYFFLILDFYNPKFTRIVIGHCYFQFSFFYYSWTRVISNRSSLIDRSNIYSNFIEKFMVFMNSTTCLRKIVCELLSFASIPCYFIVLCLSVTNVRSSWTPSWFPIYLSSVSTWKLMVVLTLKNICFQ